MTSSDPSRASAGPSGPHDPDVAGPDPSDGALSNSGEALLANFLSGKRLALARAISLVENQGAGFQTFLHRLLRARELQARRVGVTGPPGAGKSTLVAGLTTRLRAEGEEVGVVAVDPTSPYSGGALLGDRIRMNDVALDGGIFIRSMASRGSLGGLATTTAEVLDLMDAFGFPDLLVETVGVGQTELQIAGTADTVVVALVPESGDGIQAMKAGLMEIADVFVVNKADRPGADRMVRELRTAIHYRAPVGRSDHDGPPEEAAWRIPVLATVGHREEGLDELRAVLRDHARYLRVSGELARRREARAIDRVRSVAEREAVRRLRRGVAAGGPDLAARVAAGISTPYMEAGRILSGLGMHDDDETTDPPLPKGRPDDPNHVR